MKYRETIALESEEPIGHNLLLGLVTSLKKLGVEVFLFEEETYSLEKCRKLILEKGPSYVLRIERIQEAVLPRVESKHKYLLVQILRDKLKALSPSSSLVVVDSYLFPTKVRNKAEYLQMLEDIFVPVICNIETISFVTKPHFDQMLLNDARKLLLTANPSVNVVHTTTDYFHDRFWIADEKKGLFVGTSLNGIGKRYALIDNIKDVDTRDIVDELKRLSLIR